MKTPWQFWNIVKYIYEINTFIYPEELTSGILFLIVMQIPIYFTILATISTTRKYIHIYEYKYIKYI